jgi:hypothetical protein
MIRKDIARCQGLSANPLPLRAWVIISRIALYRPISPNWKY